MAGHPTYHVNVFKLKREIIWSGGLPNLSGLPDLPGVRHQHLNRPLLLLLHLQPRKINYAQLILRYTFSCK